MWSSDKQYANELVVIQEQRIYSSWVNYNEMDGNYEYTDRFCWTEVKMAELSMGGPFLHQETNQSHAIKSETVSANSTALARYI